MSFSNKIKSITLCLTIMTIPASAHFTTDNTPYDPDLCVNGSAGTYTGACSCYEPSEFSGRYCSVSSSKTCLTNSDCETGYFCALFDTSETGSCLQLIARGPININGFSAILSDSILSQKNSSAFCQALGDGYQLATRLDFNCKNTGLNCLNTDMLSALQNKFGYKLFFWLERKEKTELAYYADLNDGTVYYTTPSNQKTNQALCLKKEQGKIQ